MDPTASRIGLIAGSGQFPILFSEAAKADGRAVFAAAFINEADPELARHVSAIEWVHLGQVKRLIKFFKKNSVTSAVMMGGIKKSQAVSSLRPDSKAITILAQVKLSHDDSILRAFARVLEKEGIKIEASTFLLPGLLAPQGCWTRRRPTKAEREDIDYGWRIAKEIGRLDIGQCVVVAASTVLAVETIEGTDATIRRGGALADGGAVVVKVCKPDQDTRFDIPAVGLETVKTMQAAGARVLAIEAGRAVVFDRPQMVALADQLDMSIVALKGNYEDT